MAHYRMSRSMYMVIIPEFKLFPHLTCDEALGHVLQYRLCKDTYPLSQTRVLVDVAPEGSPIPSRKDRQPEPLMTHMTCFKFKSDLNKKITTPGEPTPQTP